jgi:hypothetical protein
MTQRERVRALVRTMYDFQDMRVRMANRLRLRKDGSDQASVDGGEPELSADAMPALKTAWEDAKKIERALAKAVEAELADIPIYQHFLKGVHGCGPLMSAIIVAEYDIEIATTRSKMWQYTGLNPGEVYGIKGEGSKRDGTFHIVRTDTKVPGDRRTPGFLSPFNGRLRTKMVGVLATSFIRLNSPYRKYYDDYKARLEAETSVNGRTGKPWSEESKGHRDKAARRYMIKMFLGDLYEAWRTLEGLPVRRPYGEEYLGHEHAVQRTAS